MIEKAAGSKLPSHIYLAFVSINELEKAAIGNIAIMKS